MSFFLVQWLKASGLNVDGAAATADVNYEFSIIGLVDIKEEYRYMLDEGRITMAMYHHRSGQNLGTVSKLCKILRRSNNKSALENEMMQLVNTPISPQEKQTFMGDIRETQHISPEYLMENNETCMDITSTNSIKHNPNKRLLAPRGHPNVSKRPCLVENWDHSEEIAALLDENHKLRRENDILREKLRDAIDISDFKNILESTLLNIQQKQLSTNTNTPPKPALCAVTANYRQEIPDAPVPEDALDHPRHLHQQYGANIATTQQADQRHLISPSSSRNTISHRSEESSHVIDRNPPQRCTTTSSLIVRHPLQQRHTTTTLMIDKHSPQQRYTTTTSTTMHNHYDKHPPQQRSITTSSMIDRHPSRQRCATTTSVMDLDEPYIVKVQSLADPAQSSKVPSTYTSTATTVNHSHQGSSRQEIAAPQTSALETRVPFQLQQYGAGDHDPSNETKTEDDDSVEYIETVVTQPHRTSESLTDNVDVAIPVTINIPSEIQVTDCDDGQDQSVHGDDEVTELFPNTGIMVNTKALKMAQKAKNFSQYTRNLMTLVFTPLQMNTCSVTGERPTGRGSSGVKQRPSLGRHKVQAIISAVQKRYRVATAQEIKSTMGQKLVDCRKVLKHRQLWGSVKCKSL